MKYDYLSEDALEKLIADTEQTGLLKAPGRIQDNVWKRIARQNQAGSAGAGFPFKSRQLQLAAYSLKVGLAAAAAIFMLFHLDGLQESEWLWHTWEVNESAMAEDSRTEKEGGANFLHTKWIEVSDWFGTMLEPAED